jgi:tRNA(Ile)-lysidine synthase
VRPPQRAPGAAAGCRARAYLPRVPHATRTPIARVDRDYHAVDRAASTLLRRHARVLLAVSGGADSMALLHAAARAAGGDRGRLLVATFDHGTGDAACAAAALVVDQCRALGVACTSARAQVPGSKEASWRAARWAFLRDVSARERAPIATAHTEDDQLETVVFRTMRGAGARGLAGLAAASDVERPFLAIPAETVREWVREHGVPWVDDPSNASRRHARNRIRHDLLPAIAAVRPGFRDEMLGLARQAAAWRTSLESLVSGFVEDEGEGRLRVAAPELAAYSSDMLAVLWPALAARGGLTLDWRGVRRLAVFTRRARFGAVIPLSGGFEVIRDRDSFALRRSARSRGPTPGVPLRGTVEFGPWHFERSASAPIADAWSAALPADRPLGVRAWQPGDRYSPGGAGPARRVKRFLADARIPAPDRAGWPVVLAGDDIVWIPGVRTPRPAVAGTARPMVTYVCRRAGS